MSALQPQHQFFRPLWRRLLTVGFCFGWALIEWLYAAPFWAVLFTMIGLVGVWQLLIAYDPNR